VVLLEILQVIITAQLHFLAESHHVGWNALIEVLVAPHFSRWPATSLHLVDKQRGAVLKYILNGGDCDVLVMHGVRDRARMNYAAYALYVEGPQRILATRDWLPSACIDSITTPVSFSRFYTFRITPRPEASFRFWKFLSYAEETTI